MIITVASGKGGTGKTTVTASLCNAWKTPLLAVDLDVEEPNLHLFLRPELEQQVSTWTEIPELDAKKCTLCGECADLCQFKAISIMISTLTLYPDMCHSCGGCIAVCKHDALRPGKRELGVIRQGQSGRTDYIMGTLRIGEAMSPLFMEQVKKKMREIVLKTGKDVLIDAPPGVSCPAIAAVADSDVIVLVTDATPFGLYDFKLAWESFAPLGKPIGAVVNRSGLGTRDIHHFCQEKNIPLLAEIPYDRSIAEAYSQGRIIADVSGELGSVFSSLREKIRALANTGEKEVGHA